MRAPRPSSPAAPTALDWGGLAVLLLAATALRVFALDLGLPHLRARPDEFPILERTVEAAQGRFDFDWGVYPPAYLYLHWLWGELWVHVGAAFGLLPTSDYVALWRDDAPRLYLIQRALSALCGVATVALAGIAAWRRLGRAAAASVAAWLALCFLHARDSHAIKPDALLALVALAVVVLSARLARAPSLGRAAWAGLAVGAAAAAKYNGVVTAAVVAVAAWAGARRGGARGVGLALPRTLLVAGLASAAFFVATSPFVLFNESSLRMLDDTLRAVFPQLFGAPTASLVDRFANVVGPDPPAWATRLGPFGTAWYHVAFSLWYGIGAVPTLLAAPALAFGFASREWLLRLAAVMVVSWFAVVAASPVMLARYMTPLLPALALLEGALVAGAVDAAARRSAAVRGALGEGTGRRALAALALTVVAMAGSLRSAVAHERLASRVDTRVAAQQWLAANAAPGSRVLVVGTVFFPWGAPQVPKGLVQAALPARGAGLARAGIDFVVAHDHELFWSTVDPGWLAAQGRALELVAEFDPRAGASDATPVFEVNDAYYLPIAGFSGVATGGPHVWIYRVRRGGGLERK
ncbi:MAG: hypothetical protein R3E88_10390 [Myxococcota bacterium]